jgi:aminoglycoside/choline kinase family phosphotransferase
MSTKQPAGLEEFLDEAGWGGSMVEPLEGDASFRRYFRIRNGSQSAMLMDAPPPHEDPGPFLHVGKWLIAQGLRAPRIYAERSDRGLVLIEDFGADRMRDWLDQHPEDEADVYARAIDALVTLHRCPAGPFDAYDGAVYHRELNLFVEWFCPLQGISADAAGWTAAWRTVLDPMMPRQATGVTVLRDYHAENIMLLPGGDQGLIDFQDALVGHRAYDLVSLLQDARRDVSIDLEREMFDRYCTKTGLEGAERSDFEADYARLGAQRNAKIVGIFARLWKRDGKPRYLAMIPRVWQALERDLAHPALAPVAEWFTVNVPREVRDTGGGELQ